MTPLKKSNFSLKICCAANREYNGDWRNAAEISKIQKTIRVLSNFVWISMIVRLKKIIIENLWTKTKPQPEPK